MNQLWKQLASLISSPQKIQKTLQNFPPTYTLNKLRILWKRQSFSIWVTLSVHKYFNQSLRWFENFQILWKLYNCLFLYYTKGLLFYNKIYFHSFSSNIYHNAISFKEYLQIISFLFNLIFIVLFLHYLLVSLYSPLPIHIVSIVSFSVLYINRH